MWDVGWPMTDVGCWMTDDRCGMLGVGWPMGESNIMAPKGSIHCSRID